MSFVRKMPGWLALIAVVCAAAAPRAMASDAVDGEQLLKNFLRDVRTMSGRFEQSLVDANDDTVERSSGHFDIKRPGQLRWKYEEPYQQILVADGLNVWSYDVDLAQVTVKPQAEVLSSTPALLLGGSTDVLQDFEYVGTSRHRNTDWVRLLPKRSDSSFESVEFGFDDGKLTRMIFSDNLDQTTLVALFDVVLNEAIDPAVFRFSPPEGVDVVGTPVPSPAIPR